MEKTADRRYFYTIVSSSTLHKDSIKYLKQIRDLYGPYLHQEKSIKTKAQNSVESFFPSELSNFEKTISSCKLCELGNSRNKFVFGVGDPFADILLVGEAPGKEEDLKGEPFVGKAGKLLDKILSAIQMNRNKNVYICNVLKCRPPENRDPLKEEIEFGKLLLYLFDSTRPFGLSVQPSLILLQKTLIHIEGMGREIYPELDFWALAEPYIDNWLLEQFNPLKLKEFLIKNKDELLLKAIEIPSYLYQALDELRSYSKDKKSNEEKITKMQFQLLKEKYILRLVGMVVVIIGSIMIILRS